MKKIIIIVITLLVLGGGAGIFFKIKSSGGKAIEVYTEKVSKNDVVSTVTAFGQVKPRVEVEVSSKVTGEIKKLYVEEGDSVKKGDLLVELDRKISEAQVDQMRASYQSSLSSLEQTKANLRQLKQDYERTKQMYEKGLVAPATLEKMQTELSVMQASLNSSENSVARSKSSLNESVEQLGYTRIVSPMDGVIIGLKHQEGEYVVSGAMSSTGSVIMTVAQLDSMEVAVSVDETDVVNIQIGQRVNITFDAIVDSTYQGIVRKISNMATTKASSQDQTIAEFKVEITILDVPSRIRSGMSVTTEIITKEANDVFTVPIAALVSGQTPKEPKWQSLHLRKNRICRWL